MSENSNVFLYELERSAVDAFTACDKVIVCGRRRARVLVFMQ